MGDDRRYETSALQEVKLAKDAHVIDLEDTKQETKSIKQINIREKIEKAHQGGHQTPIKNMKFVPAQIWPTIPQVVDVEEGGVDCVE